MQHRLSATDQQLDKAVGDGASFFDQHPEPEVSDGWRERLMPFETLEVSEGPSGVACRVAGQRNYAASLAILELSTDDEKRLRALGLKCSPEEASYLLTSWILAAKADLDHRPDPTGTAVENRHPPA